MTALLLYFDNRIKFQTNCRRCYFRLFLHWQRGVLSCLNLLFLNSSWKRVFKSTVSWKFFAGSWGTSRLVCFTLLGAIGSWLSADTNLLLGGSILIEFDQRGRFPFVGLGTYLFVLSFFSATDSPVSSIVKHVNLEGSILLLVIQGGYKKQRL